MKLPITEVKDLATAVADSFEAVESFATGKPVEGAGRAFAALKEYGDVDWPQVLPQAADIDGPEAQELAAHFAEKLDLKADTVEATIELGVGILADAIPGILALKAAWDRWQANRNRA